MHLLTYSPGLPDGERKSLSEIQNSIVDIDWKAGLSDELQQKLIEELVEYRKTKHTGMRATNKSAQNDIIRTCEHVACEVFPPASNPHSNYS